MNSLPKLVAETMEAEYPEVVEAVATLFPEQFVVTAGGAWTH